MAMGRATALFASAMRQTMFLNEHNVIGSVISCKLFNAVTAKQSQKFL